MIQLLKRMRRREALMALLCAVLIAAGISIRGLFLLMGMLNLLMLPITKKLSGINDN